MNEKQRFVVVVLILSATFDLITTATLGAGQRPVTPKDTTRPTQVNRDDHQLSQISVLPASMRQGTEPKTGINVSGQPATVTISPPTSGQLPQQPRQPPQPDLTAAARQGYSPSQWWTIAPTIAVAAFTLGLLVFTGFQVHIYYQIRDHEMIVERAWISITHQPPGVEITETSVTAAGEEAFGGWHNAVLRFEIRNSGNTPARITDISMGHHISTPDQPPPPPTGPGTREHAFLLKDGALSDKREFKIKHTEREQLRLTLRLWLLGYVDYIDAFNVRRRAGYARFYDQSIDDAARPRGQVALPDEEDRWKRRNNLQFETRVGYNYDRERKNGEGNDWDV
jgi:hypothetical protein